MILDVGVAKLPLYWIWSPPTVHPTRFISFLCGLSVVTMRIYLAFLLAVLSLWSMKKIMSILADISGPYPSISVFSGEVRYIGDI